MFVSLHLGPCLSGASICAMFVSLHLGPWLSASIWVHVRCLHLCQCLSASIWVHGCQPLSGSMFIRCLHLCQCLSVSIWVHGCQPPSRSMSVRCLHLCQCLSASIWVHVCQMPPSVSMFVSLHLGPWLSGASAPCSQPPSGSKLVRCRWSMLLAICVHVVCLHAYHSGTLPPAVQVQCSVGPIKKSSCCKTNITTDAEPFFPLYLGRT